jgi:hypothetical protein
MMLDDWKAIKNSLIKGVTKYGPIALDMIWQKFTG